MNIVMSEPFNRCPITDREVNYNFISPNPGIDGYEYKIDSLNRCTIICITGSALSDGYLSKLKRHKEKIEKMIINYQGQEFTIDTLLLHELE